MRHSQLIHWAVLSMVAPALSSCVDLPGLSKQNGATSPNTTPITDTSASGGNNNSVVLSLAAFQSTFYADVQSLSCTTCHASGPGPAYLSPNVANAFQVAIQYVNVADVTASLFVTQMNNGHCGIPTVCGNGGSPSIDVTPMVTALNQWIAESAGAPVSLTYQANPLNVIIGSAVSETAAHTGASPSAYALSAGGVLPPGLSLNPNTGTISGAPTAIGSYSFTVVGSNANGSAKVTVTVTVSPLAPASISYSSNPLNGTASSAITDNLSYTGGAPTSYALTAGALPPGFAPVSPSTGTISGTPTATGTFTATITGSNAAGSASVSLTITITAPAVGQPTGIAYASSPFNLVNGQAGSDAIGSFSGGAPTSYAVLGGTLPGWLSLNTGNGTLSGTPTAVGTSSIEVQASNSSGSANTTLTIVVLPQAPQTIAYANATPVATVGTPFSDVRATYTGGSPTSYALSGTVPAWLAVDGSGTLSGTPTTPGTFGVTVTGSNSNTSGSARTLVTITVNPSAPGTLTYQISPFNVTAGFPATDIFVGASGGQPTSFAVASGTTPPSWVTLNTASGAVTASPPAGMAAGSYSISVVGINVTGTSSSPTVVPVILTAASSGGGTLSQAAFQSTVYAYINQNQCNSCHGDGSTVTSNETWFASANINTAYASALNFITTSNIGGSPFAEFVANGHCIGYGFGELTSQTEAQICQQTSNCGMVSALCNWASASQLTIPACSAPCPTASPVAASTPTATPTSTSLYGSTFVPTSSAVLVRLQNALSQPGAPYTCAGTPGCGFLWAMSGMGGKVNLPGNSNPNLATGSDQISLFAYAACTDLGISANGYSGPLGPNYGGLFSGVTLLTGDNTLAPLAPQVNNLVNAGLMIVNAHTGGLLSMNSTLNQQVTAIFQNLLSDPSNSGATASQGWLEVCTAANTFGLGMRGF